MSTDRHVVVLGLGYGDEGKGSVTDWLCSPAGPSPVTAVIRFNGGAQAGHNVVLPDGRHHTFSQFGSGTFHGVPTYLSQFMLVNPLALSAEAAALEALGVTDPLSLLSVDSRAWLTTPYHVAAGVARERARCESPHGSCGMGIGVTAEYAAAHPADAPRVFDCIDAGFALARKLKLLWAELRAADGRLSSYEVPTAGELVDAYAAFGARVRITSGSFLRLLLARGRCVFEGAQGVLLDERHGFHPHTTWSNCTAGNALALCPDAFVLGVTRTYATRHGRGPFVSYDPRLMISGTSAGDPVLPVIPEPHNRSDPPQEDFRIGHWDAVAFRYALSVSPVDGVALTHLDSAEDRPELRVCDAYQIGTRNVGVIPQSPVDLMERTKRTMLLDSAWPVLSDPHPGGWERTVRRRLGVPVLLTSHGPTWQDKEGDHH